MIRGWEYRVVTVLGVAGIVALTLVGVTTPLAHRFASGLPLVARLAPPTSTPPGPLQGLMAVAVFLAAFVPLYKPRPRRILDVLVLAERRTVTAVVWVAAVSYFDKSLGLSRLTLLLAVPPLAVALPALFVAVRRRPPGGSARTLIVGNDADEIGTVLSSSDLPFVGYVAPSDVAVASEGASIRATDGGSSDGRQQLRHLGGLTRLEEVLVGHDIDTAVLAFDRPDRGEFFGALDACYDHGVTAKVHRSRASRVLTTGFGSDELVEVDLEPLDWQDYLLKRLFDVAFATVGLVVFAPLVLLVAVAVYLDDGSPIIYRQERTATFGDTFTVRKFRTMAETSTGASPVPETTNRDVTRVGAVLRALHLDELPQLWSILVGDMSVVGPRAAWTEEETLLEGQAESWRKRWFVTPGLTGLAQINDVSSTDPERKLRYDIEYIRRQSLPYDLKIVVRQLWLVVLDIVALLRGRSPNRDE